MGSMKILMAMMLLVAIVDATCPGACSSSTGECCPFVILCTSADGVSGCDTYVGTDDTHNVDGTAKDYKYMKMGGDSSVTLFSGADASGDDEEFDEEDGEIDVSFSVKSISIS